LKRKRIERRFKVTISSPQDLLVYISTYSKSSAREYKINSSIDCSILEAHESTPETIPVTSREYIAASHEHHSSYIC
jgi:hypothetical protein